MTVGHKLLPWSLIAAGLLGLGVYFIGDHYQLPIVPTADFARGLWFGVCLGAEMLGGMLVFKSKARPKSAR